MEVHVKVTAGAYKELVCDEDGVLEIYVKEPPAGGMANRRVLQLVARHYEVMPDQVRMVRGHHSRRKVFWVGT